LHHLGLTQEHLLLAGVVEFRHHTLKNWPNLKILKILINIRWMDSLISIYYLRLKRLDITRFFMM
jgi:hypothetical protein